MYTQKYKNGGKSFMLWCHISKLMGIWTNSKIILKQTSDVNFFLYKKKIKKKMFIN